LVVAEDSINKEHQIYFQDTVALDNQPHHARRVIWEAPETNLHDNTKGSYQLSPAWTIIHIEMKP
jgi:hypothetical protein